MDKDRYRGPCWVGGCTIDADGKCGLVHGLEYEAEFGAVSLRGFEEYVGQVLEWREQYCKRPSEVTDEVIEAARQTCRERLERPELPPGLPDPLSW
jgi:hypothetical protein